MSNEKIESKWSLSDVLDISFYSPIDQMIHRNNCIDVRNLPMTHVIKGSQDREALVGFGSLAVSSLIGLLWIVFSRGFGIGEYSWMFVAVPALAVFGSLFLNVLVHKREITISKSDVIFCERKLLGIRSWNVQLSSYLGVLRCVWTGRHRYKYYELVLHHQNADRRIRLLYVLGRYWVPELHFAFAKSLGLPVLIEKQGGKIKTIT